MHSGSIKFIIILLILIFNNLDIPTIHCDQLTLFFDSKRLGLGICFSNIITTQHNRMSGSGVTVEDLDRMAKQQTELIMRLREEDRKERATERSEDIVPYQRR